MTERKKNPQTKANYYYLLEDPDVKRWYDNMARGSLATAAVVLVIVVPVPLRQSCLVQVV